MHKPNYRIFVKRTTALFVALLTLASSLLMIMTPVNAESGTDSTGGWASGSYTLCKNGGYRPYLEYYCSGETTTAGVTRKTYINVYMKAGERIALGSSVYNSTLNIDDASGGSGCDIVIVEPNGTKVSKDVIQNADGYISSVAKETAGPNVENMNPDGFTPIYYTAAIDGIYQVRFHSPTGANSNPQPRLTTAAWQQSNSTVAAWNVTVLNAENEVQSGRIYTKCLALNMGSNSGVTLNSNVYVVTSDGYIYNTDFNGMNPFGFVFFANNRGLVSTKTNYSLYQSFASKNNQISDLVAQGATYQNPWSPDTDMDKTFNIFFESPDPELEGILYPTSYEPETAKNLSFIGSKGDYSSHIGYGGYFKFDVTNATSATITIDFTNVLLSDGTYANYGKVKLSNAVTHGTNYFHWDGCGENGTPIPVGTYDNSSIKVSVETFSGEYHFPLFDVEAAPNGIKVTRINTIYRETVDADGNIYKLDVSKDYEAGKSDIFYDNASREKVTSYQNPAGKIADSVNAISGVDSSGGAMKFNTNSDGKSLGDQTALDIWTHSNNGDPLTISLTTPIEITDDLFTILSGRIFYDEIYTAGAPNNFFALNENDYALKNIEVQLSYMYEDIDGLLHTVTDSTITDSYGRYFFAGIPIMDNGNVTSCSVTVIKPLDSYTLTTGNTTTNSSLTSGTELQSVSLGGKDENNNIIYLPSVSLSDVGYHYERLNTNIEIKKDWVTDISSDKARPAEVHLTVQSYYTDALGTRVNVKQYVYVLSNANRWIVYVNELPAYEDVAGTRALRYEIISETYTMRTGGASYTFQSGNSPDAYPYNTSFSCDETHSEAVVLTAKNAPKKGSIQLVKRDSEDHSLTLSGVEFVLWEKTRLSAIPPGQESDYREASGIIYHKEQTGLTNENGIITFSNLDMNSFFVIETAAKVGYKLDSTAYSFTLSDDQQFLNRTIYNTPLESTLTVVKQIDQVMAGAAVPITVTYSSDAAFTNPMETSYTVNITGNTLTYAVCTSTIPSGSYVKISEGSCSYILNPSQSNVVDTTDGITVKPTYSSDEAFQLTDGHAYTVTLKNNAQYLDTFHVQKLWLDSDGHIMDETAYNISNHDRNETAAFGDISYAIERTTDYVNWESVTQRTNGNTVAGIDTTLFGDLKEVGTSGSGKQLIWTKRFGSTYWHLPKYDNSGNLYTYRISEDGLSQSGFTQFTGEITYSTVTNASGNKETTASFVNPVTGNTTTYTAAGNYGVYKNDSQQNLILVNYRSSLSYTMKVKKIDGSTHSPLKGATFSLYSNAECTIEVSSETTAIDGSGDATAAFSGLDIGTYYFKETAAPSGYVLPADIKEVVISPDGSVSVDGHSVSVDSDTFSVTVANSLQVVLPQSGTPVSAMLVMLTGITICIAGLIFVLILKKKDGDSSV